MNYSVGLTPTYYNDGDLVLTTYCLNLSDKGISIDVSLVEATKHVIKLVVSFTSKLYRVILFMFTVEGGAVE